MKYELEDLLKVRIIRKDKASDNVVKARRALQEAVELVEIRKKELEEFKTLRLREIERLYSNIMKKDIRKACVNDTLEDTVHYGFVHDDVVTLAKTNKFKLIEKLAEEIAKMIIEKYGVEEVTVLIEKPNAPINGIFKYVAVEITRSKKDYE